MPYLVYAREVINPCIAEQIKQNQKLYIALYNIM